MARAIRYHESFKDDLVERVRWPRQHRPLEQIANLQRALAAFTERIAAFPGLGEELERRGGRSYRRFTIGGALPYIVWYYYDADDRTPVWLLMLMHEDQDRERFSPERFEV